MANSARIDELRKKFDENPRRYFAPLANEYRKAGDLEQAIFICQEYLPQQPGHMSGHIVHGQALYDLGRTDEAKVAFETALSLDPENLIALRHLGDIARQMGDTDSARMWYQRVLEADPRNEEIAQLMISLLSTPEPGSVNPSAPTPIASAEPVTPPDSWRSAVPAEASSAGDAGAALELEKSEEASVPEPVEASATPTPVSTPTPPKTDTDFRRRYEEDELLDFDDASIGGLPLAEVAPNVQVEAPRSEREDAAEPTAGDMPEFSSMEVDERSEIESAPPRAAETLVASETDAAFEADPFAIATPAASVEDTSTPIDAAMSFDAGEPEPDVERATDIVLGLPDDGRPLTQSAEDTTVANATLEGLETFEPGIIGAPNTTTSVGTESYFADDAETAAADSDESVSDDAGSDEAEPEVSAAESESDEFGAFAPAESSAELPPLHTPVWSSVTIETVETTLESLTPPGSLPDLTSPFDDKATDFTSEPQAMEESTQDSAVEFAHESAHESAPIDGGHDGREAPESLTELPDSEAAAEPAQPFVTETMAELYLQQGHLESALDIYQRLVEQRPDDEVLASRLRAVEDQLYGSSEAADDEAPTPTAFAGPTIREFLISVFSRTRQPLPSDDDFGSPGIGHDAQPMSLAEEATFENPAMAEEAGLGHPETFEAVAAPEAPASVAFETYEEMTTDFDEPSETDGSESVDDSSVEPANQSAAPSAARPTPAAAAETVRGSIDALFSGADASTADTTAATTLADAFPPEAEAPTPPLNGIPAHRATDELSLDHVFKGNTPPRPSTEVDGFSFDQFFAANADDAPPASNAPSTAEPDAGDDIAQFNAWLNGLKKS